MSEFLTFCLDAILVDEFKGVVPAYKLPISNPMHLCCTVWGKEGW